MAPDKTKRKKVLLASPRGFCAGVVRAIDIVTLSPEVRAIAQARDLKVIDATCPLVTKVHLEAIKYARAGFTIILIGHADHDEVIGTMGEAPSAMLVVGSAEDVD